MHLDARTDRDQVADRRRRVRTREGVVAADQQDHVDGLRARQVPDVVHRLDQREGQHAAAPHLQAGHVRDHLAAVHRAGRHEQDRVLFGALLDRQETAAVDAQAAERAVGHLLNDLRDRFLGDVEALLVAELLAHAARRVQDEEQVRVAAERAQFQPAGALLGDVLQGARRLRQEQQRLRRPAHGIVLVHPRPVRQLRRGQRLNSRRVPLQVAQARRAQQARRGLDRPEVLRRRQVLGQILEHRRRGSLWPGGL